MVVERPAETVVKTFDSRLGNVVQQRCPAQPQVVRCTTQPVEYHQRMGEVILMPDAFFRLDALKSAQFGEDQFQ